MFSALLLASPLQAEPDRASEREDLDSASGILVRRIDEPRVPPLPSVSSPSNEEGSAGTLIAKASLAAMLFALGLALFFQTRRRRAEGARLARTEAARREAEHMAAVRKAAEWHAARGGVLERAEESPQIPAPGERVSVARSPDPPEARAVAAFPASADPRPTPTVGTPEGSDAAQEDDLDEALDRAWQRALADEGPACAHGEPTPAARLRGC